MPIGFYECQECRCCIDAFIAEDKCPKCGSDRLEYWDVSTYCDECSKNNLVDDKKDDESTEV